MGRGLEGAALRKKIIVKNNFKFKPERIPQGRPTDPNERTRFAKRRGVLLEPPVEDETPPKVRKKHIKVDPFYFGQWCDEHGMNAAEGAQAFNISYRTACRHLSICQSGKAAKGDEGHQVFETKLDPLVVGRWMYDNNNASCRAAAREFGISYTAAAAYRRQYSAAVPNKRSLKRTGKLPTKGNPFDSRHQGR